MNYLFFIIVTIFIFSLSYNLTKLVEEGKIATKLKNGKIIESEASVLKLNCKYV